jgi:hypothetical protein
MRDATKKTHALIVSDEASNASPLKLSYVVQVHASTATYMHKACRAAACVERCVDVMRYQERRENVCLCARLHTRSARSVLTSTDGVGTLVRIHIHIHILTVVGDRIVLYTVRKSAFFVSS